MAFSKRPYSHLNTLVVLYLVFCFICAVAMAKNVGAVGTTYPVLEEDFLDFIQRHMAEMKHNGEWEKVKERFQQDVKSHADRPTPVKDITKTSIKKTWLYDPSVIVPHDMRDKEGHVFVKAGTMMNPLSMVALHKALVFYDGDDKDQVAWAKRMDDRYQHKIKLILVKGSIMEQQKIFNQAVYFDQQGRLTSRFHIEHVPAWIIQEGFYLRVSEMSP